MDKVFKSEGQFQGHKSYSCKMLKLVIYCNLHKKLEANISIFKSREKRDYFSSFEVSIAKEFDD